MHGMAQVVIAKHRKGATGDVLLNFRGEFTRFQNPEDAYLAPPPPSAAGEIVGSRMNGDDNPFGAPPPDMGNGTPF